MKSISPSLLRPALTERSSSANDPAVLIDFRNSAMSGCPTLALIAATTTANGLEEVTLKRWISILLMVIFSFPLVQVVLRDHDAHALDPRVARAGARRPSASCPRNVIQVLEARATSRSCSSTTSHSTRPTLLP